MQDENYIKSNVRNVKWDNRLAEFSEIIQRDSTNVQAWCMRGGVYLARGEYSKAISDYTEAISLQSTDAQLYAARASAYYCAGDMERAMTDSSQAIQLDPNCAESL